MLSASSVVYHRIDFFKCLNLKNASFFFKFLFFLVGLINQTQYKHKGFLCLQIRAKNVTRTSNMSAERYCVIKHDSQSGPSMQMQAIYCSTSLGGKGKGLHQNNSQSGSFMQMWSCNV